MIYCSYEYLYQCNKHFVNIDQNYLFQCNIEDAYLLYNSFVLLLFLSPFESVQSLRIQKEQYIG